ncbi:MAG: PIN domain-containing protein [Deltaproteobacteria bacterium]|nr:PIN domain-containing protein [Deltaproteobacteria bacterium]
MIHLDTSFLIGALDQGSPQDRSLRRWVGDGETLAVSAVAWSEFLCGPFTRADLELARQVIGIYRDFTPDHAAIAARLFSEAGRRRGSLPDCMIAASAMADSAPIATANEADFRRFEDAGLILAG